ncbi:MAG: hypothetical protein VYE62_01525, partial [Pseudomonadota bacterium]|nr:hypothetical protein [Pseudomonadota bacterium]
SNFVLFIKFAWRILSKSRRALLLTDSVSLIIPYKITPRSIIPEFVRKSGWVVPVLDINLS